MGKLDKLKKVSVKMPDVSKVIRVHAKPDRYAIWIAKAVAFILTPPRQRRMMGQDVVNTQYAFLKGVIDSEAWREKCGNLGFRGDGPATSMTRFTISPCPATQPAAYSRQSGGSSARSTGCTP